jgi:nitroreductase
MNVSEAILSRKSIRAFLSKPVPNALVSELLVKSARAANGGNLQPWKVFVINEKSMEEFKEFQSNWVKPETPSYNIYPPKLKEPYRTSRFELGEQMYALLDISREDKEGRITWVLKNFNFFDAPAAIFCFVDKQMGPPQWSDLGMFLQNFMLLAKEAGLDTCAQEAWSLKSDSVSEFVGANDDDMLFCGMAIGYADKDAQVNQLISERRPIDQWATFL